MKMLDWLRQRLMVAEDHRRQCEADVASLKMVLAAAERLAVAARTQEVVAIRQMQRERDADTDTDTD